MTVRDYILDGSIKSEEMRLEKLKAMGAPEVLVKSLEDSIFELKLGVLKISGDLNLLDEEFVSREIKTGNGGKMYIRINDHINYFPNAKYGKYIKEV